MWALLFLAGAALLGSGLVRRALGGLLSFDEQLMWGTVAGWAVTTCAAYFAARAAGHLSAEVLIAPLVVTYALAALLWLPEARGLRRRQLPARRLWNSDYTGLLAVLAIFTPLYARLFWAGVPYRSTGGIYTTGNDDVGFHLAVINSFLH